MPKIILASTSPRRKDIMEKLHMPFITIAPDYEEDMSLPLPPKKLAAVLSLGKAESVAQKHKNAILIGSDTFVSMGSEVIGKPKSKEEAANMLRKFSGKDHSILTGIAMLWPAKKKKFSAVVETKVYFRKLSKKDIDRYLSGPEYKDKAGGYAIQGLGGAFIERIEGDFTGVIGLSLSAVIEGFLKFGIDVFRNRKNV